MVAPFVRRVRHAAKRGLITLKFRHRVNALSVTSGVVDGVQGDVLESSEVERGRPSSRTVIGSFVFTAQAVIVTSGGIGGNHELVRQNWPTARLGEPPKHMLTGVPDYVDGRMLAITQAAGGRIVNRDRMWHYTEGIQNWNPIWTNHGIRILPGPSSLWLDAQGNRLPVPLFPGFDTLGTLAHIMRTGYDYTWFVLTQRIIEREFALSGSEQNPDLTNKQTLKIIGRATGGVPGPVAAFMKHGADFVVEPALPDLVRGMNALTDEPLLDPATLEREIIARDREMDNPFTKDMQVTAIRAARAYRGDRLIRTAAPHKLLDRGAGPLIAVRLHILTRKTLGGLQTDLSGRVLDATGRPVPGLYAAGEVAGFGGGGIHGYRALEGSFLGGCLFSGRVTGGAVAKSLA